MNRKQFFLLLSGTTLAACKREGLTPLPPASLPPATPPVRVYLTADLATELLTVGSVKMDTVRGIFVQRIATGNAVASFLHFSLSCTHSGCIVAHQTASGEFHCPCHGSKFAADGSVMNGPAARPLDKFVLSVDGTTLKVTDR